MPRKALLVLCLVLCACSTMVPLAAEAQKPAKVYRIGWLSPEATGDTFAASLFDTFKKELRDLGYVEGQNIVIDVRRSEGKNELLPSLAAELVALKPDVIVAQTTPGMRAARQATATIPVVIVRVSDPVGSGIIASLAHPGGNITGVIDYGLDLAAKHVELVRVIVPKATRITVLMSDNAAHPSQLKVIQDAAMSIGITVLPTMDRTDEELEQAFATMVKANAEALIVLGGSPQREQEDRIIRLAAKTRLPTIYPARHWVEKGGLASMGSDTATWFRQAAHYVDKILKGAKPGDLPVEQPTKVELVINLKTAKALGIAIPQSLLMRADEVIQ
jgi:putative tryptophan/tyrosine transport system substrate-binding protein